MSNEEAIISQAVGLAGGKLAEMNEEMNAYLREILKEEAKRLSKDLQITDPKILAEKLNDLVGRMNQVFRKKTNQPSTDWFYINSYSTYYQNNDPQKIVVNVISDNAPPKVNAPKSNYIENFSEKRNTYKSSNKIIGSRTIEDLFQVIRNQRSTTAPINERVIIIDNYDSDSSDEPQQPTAPKTTSPAYTPQQPVFYDTQFVYTSLPSFIYLTTAPTNLHPFTYFRY